MPYWAWRCQAETNQVCTFKLKFTIGTPSVSAHTFHYMDPFHMFRVTRWQRKPVQLDGHLGWLHFHTYGSLNRCTNSCIMEWQNSSTSRDIKMESIKVAITLVHHCVTWNSSSMSTDKLTVLAYRASSMQCWHWSWQAKKQAFAVKQSNNKIRQSDGVIQH